MKWVKIEDGCEMPENWKPVLVCCTCNSNSQARYFCTATPVDGEFTPHDEQVEFGNGDWQETPTHWARVELPEE